MATTAMLDLRRTDLRTNVLENPYWISSMEITPTCDDKAAVLFSFPISATVGSICPAFYGNSIVIIQEMVMEVNTVFAGAGTEVFTLGGCSLDTQAQATTVTTTTENTFATAINASGIDLTTEGLYELHASSNYDSDKVLGQHTTNYTIVPANTTVLCIAAFLSSDNVISTGSAYLHMLVAMPPVVS